MLGAGRGWWVRQARSTVYPAGCTRVGQDHVQPASMPEGYTDHPGYPSTLATARGSTVWDHLASHGSMQDYR